MSVDATAEVRIDRPRPEVAAYLFDPSNDPEWIGGVREVRMLDDGRVARVAYFLGRRIEYVNEIVELVPDERLRMRSVAGPFPMDIVYELSEDTVFRNHVRGDASRFLPVPLLSAMVRRNIQKDAERLRDVLS